MKYKNTSVKEGELVYLGMEQKWVETQNGVKFITGMHFRDATHPIKIRRYPGDGSMVTDSQRIGVITGQFIRAQRLCSTLFSFKDAVQNIVLAAMRRGYKRREMDRVWGKFLVKWWKAEEVRRGELRSWFRKMSGVAHRRVWQENSGREQNFAQSPRQCRHGNRCLWKSYACPFTHPKEGAPRAPRRQGEGESTAPSEKNPHNREHGDPREIGDKEQPPPRGEGEIVPKAQGQIWKATADGSCLFYCVAHSNSCAAAIDRKSVV